MARKKGTPQKAREYKVKAPGKAKDGSDCYTRQGNAGSYVTCTGTQKSGGGQTGKAVRSGPPPKGTKKGQVGRAKRTGGAPGQAKQTGKAVRSGPPPKGTKKGMAKRTGGSPSQAKAKRVDEKFDRHLSDLHSVKYKAAVEDLRAFALTNPILKHHDDLSGTKI